MIQVVVPSCQTLFLSSSERVDGRFHRVFRALKIRCFLKADAVLRDQLLLNWGPKSEIENAFDLKKKKKKKSE